MNLHTTNYYNAFIEIAPDCPTTHGEIPSLKGGKKTTATHQFELIYKNPYQFTSDEVLFKVFAERNDLIESEYEDARKQFFSKGQACLRAFPLTKRYGWGVHYNEEGKVAIYSIDSEAYTRFLEDENVKKYKAMRSSK